MSTAPSSRRSRGRSATAFPRPRSSLTRSGRGGGGGSSWSMAGIESPRPAPPAVRQADVDLRKGVTVSDVCRRLGISRQTYSLGGRGTAAKRWLRRHESEDGQTASGTPEGELEAEQGRSGSGPRHTDPEGSRPPKLTFPERRRRTVESVRRHLGHEKVSERRVCRVLGQNRGTQRHRPRKTDGDRELLAVMRKIVESFPRHGSERMHRELTDPEAFGGWRANIKRVHRIWKEEHMQVRCKQRKRRRLPGASANACSRHKAMHRNHVWSFRL